MRRFRQHLGGWVETAHPRSRIVLLCTQGIYQNNTKTITHFVVVQQSEVGDGDVTTLARKIAQAARVCVHPCVTQTGREARARGHGLWIVNTCSTVFICAVCFGSRIAICEVLSVRGYQHVVR